MPPVQNSTLYTPGSPNIGWRTVTVEMLISWPGTSLAPGRLELEGHRRQDELALRVGQAKLDLVCLSDVGGAEAEARDHRESGSPGQRRHRECAESTAEHVELPIGRNHGAVGEEGEAQIHRAVLSHARPGRSRARVGDH